MVAGVVVNDPHEVVVAYLSLVIVLDGLQELERLRCVQTFSMIQDQILHNIFVQISRARFVKHCQGLYKLLLQYNW